MDKILKYSNLKDGMRVIDQITGYKGIIVKFNKDYHFCQNNIVSLGSVPDELRRGYAYSYPILQNSINPEILNLSLIKKNSTINDLETGDTIIKNGVEFYVEQISPSVFVLIRDKGNDKLEKTLGYLSITELKSQGFKLKAEEPEQPQSDIIEMTLQEIAHMRGIPVDKLRIKLRI